MTTRVNVADSFPFFMMYSIINAYCSSYRGLFWQFCLNSRIILSIFLFLIAGISNEVESSLKAFIDSTLKNSRSRNNLSIITCFFALFTREEMICFLLVNWFKGNAAKVNRLPDSTHSKLAYPWPKFVPRTLSIPRTWLFFFLPNHGILWMSKPHQTDLPKTPWFFTCFNNIWFVCWNVENTLFAFNLSRW